VSIFIDEDTKVLIQGITGKEGSYWINHMKEMGTCVAAGITPGKAMMGFFPYWIKRVYKPGRIGL